MSDFDVVVYGATGFTGRLICKELQRRQVRFAVAGRDRQKLTALAGSLASASPAVLEAPVDDRPRLEAALARGKVVLACAGPFVRLGAPVRDAALATGRHYLDITGEAGYMLQTWALDNQARARNVALINAVGFDVVPTDSAAALATEALGTRPDWVKIAIRFGGRATQGTTRSALENAHTGGLAYLDGQLARERVGKARWQAPFPSPVGRRDAISIPWGDLATTPRSTGARNVRTFMTASPVAATLAPVLGGALKALAWKPIQKLAERLVQRLPEGPSDAERARARCAVVAEASGAGRAATAWLLCGDGYDFTAVSAVECAVRAAAPDFMGRGALTPSQAFGARTLLDALAASGAVQFGVD